jgi:RNA polymerase-binding protein DksA
MAEETKIDTATLEAIKGDLLKRKAEVEKELNLVARKENDGGEDEYKATFPNYGDKPDENVMEIAEYEANIAEENILERSLRDINQALERIDGGSYGICKHCGKPIDPRRLQARPTAGSCVDCKTKLQQS